MRCLLSLLILLNLSLRPSLALDSASKITSFSLANGLHVVVAVRPELKLAAVNLTINLGALDDPIGESGMAHMLEHTTLSGAENVGSLNPRAEAVALAELDRAKQALEREKSKPDPDATVILDLERWAAQAQRSAQATAEDREVIGSRLEARGAVGLNATTSADVTQFFTSIPTGDVDYWLSLEAARLQHPIFRRYYLERNVVLREVQGLTAGRATIQELLLREMFPGSPVSKSMAGDPRELGRIDRPTALGYFRREYRPDRTAIAIVGNVKPEAIRAACERYFGAWRSQVETDMPIQPEPVAAKPTPYIRTFNSSHNPVVLMAFAESAKSPTELAANAVLAELIGSEDLSPLYIYLVESRSLAWNVEASPDYPSPKHPLVFLLHLYAMPGVAEKQLIDAAQERLRDLSVLPIEDIKGGIFCAEMRAASQLDDAPSLAALLASSQATQQDWKVPFDRLRAIRTLSVEDVRAAARRMFGEPPRRVEAAAGE